MKHHLLLLGVLCTTAMACESRDLATASVEPASSRHLIAATQSGKSGPAKQTSPAAPNPPAPKPADKHRRARPARPEYLFL